MLDEDVDLTHAHTLAEHLQERAVPLCPQLRPAHAEWLYPVKGYCVLDRSPGWFMIPSIEEYRSYCTTPRFRECCWFGGAAAGPSPGPDSAHSASRPMQAGAWQLSDRAEPSEVA